MIIKESKLLGTTFSQFILLETQNVPCLQNLPRFVVALQTAIKNISNFVRKDGILLNYNTKGKMLLYKEKRCETVADEILTSALVSSFSTCLLISPEKEEAYIVEEEKQGDLIVCFDPLDGTSNIEALTPVGTIFSVFRKKSKGPVMPEDCFQAGKDALICGYVLYGSATTLLVSIGNGVVQFLLDTSLGEFVLINSNFKIPRKGKIYSINEGYSKFWYDPLTKFIQNLKKQKNESEGFSGRYIGSMVADVHRTLSYGGLFLYPATKECPKGKVGKVLMIK